MEKISRTINSSEIPEELFIFKTHLTFIEKGWLPLDGNVVVESFQSSTGQIYSSIIHHEDEKKIIIKIDFYIDDNATLKDIDLFLNKVLSGKNEANFGEWFVMNFQTRYFDYIVTGVSQRLGFHFEGDPKKWNHNLFAAPASKPDQISVPQGYILGPLLEGHTAVITTQWALDIGFKNKDDSTLHSMVLAEITQRPCFGIFSQSDPATLIAWLTVNGGGSIGKLHVKESHRRRGLARILVRHTLKTVQDIHGVECRVHSCAKKDNTASMGLFLSEGWQLQPFNYKIILFRKTE